MWVVFLRLTTHFPMVGLEKSTHTTRFHFVNVNPEAFPESAPGGTKTKVPGPSCVTLPTSGGPSG